MATAKITIRGSKRNIVLDQYGFMNFLYTEDINLGFPTIEFGLRDNLYAALREDLYGDEEIWVEHFENDKFKLVDKTFKIKSIGSGGVGPKPATAQTLKIVAVDKNYDAILKNDKSVYFLPTEVKKISDLIKKLLNQVGITANGSSTSTGFAINITPTMPTLDQGYQNLFIPYSRDPLKVIRKLCNYSVSENGLGGFVFFINRKGLNFTPVGSLFKQVTDDSPYLLITDVTQQYGLNEVKLSTFNAFTNFITGHEKKLLGFNLMEKDYNSITYTPDAKYVEYSAYENKQQKAAPIQTMPLAEVGNSNAIPFAKDFLKGNIKTYYTPLDNPKALLAFGDKMYYAQMFTYVLEIDADMVSVMPDFTIGEMVNIEFKTTDADKWSSLNGGWLLKSMKYIYPADNVTLKLVRIGSAQLPDTKYLRLGA